MIRPASVVIWAIALGAQSILAVVFLMKQDWGWAAFCIVFAVNAALLLRGALRA